jgi:hypothetical protein
MRTTLSISDELLAAAKCRAHERGVTLSQVVDAALQRELNEVGASSQGPRIPVFRGGSGPRPGVDLNSNRALLELLDEGVDLDQRR